MREFDAPAGGQGGFAARSELEIERLALRQDWPIPPAVKRTILQRLVTYLDVETDEGKTAPDRTVISAAKTLALFMRLGLDQAKLDLVERKLDGISSGLDPSQFTERAEALAIARRLELDSGAAD